MPMIPAFCDACGHAFPSGIFAENCLHLTLSGNRSGPCPQCGSMGTVLEGIFDVTKDLIEIVSAPAWTYQKIKRVEEIFTKLQGGEISERTARGSLLEEDPELSTLLDVLPKTRPQLYAFLGLILMALTLVLSRCSTADQSNKEGFQKPDLQYVLNEAVSELQK